MVKVCLEYAIYDYVLTNKIILFWDVLLSSLVDTIPLVEHNAAMFKLICFALMMKASSFSGTFVSVH
jgi:hypothetical protein